MDFKTAQRRSEIIQKIRKFFADKSVLEVETPILSQGSSTDCHIDVFTSEYHPAGYKSAARSETVYLQTSPEFAMKRLLAEGFGDIFQICKVFRNGELGRTHHPEFTMLEWYRKGFSLSDLMDETAALLREILGNRPIVRKTYAALFQETTGINPLATTTSEVAACCSARGKSTPGVATLTDALQFAMAELVEPALPPDAIAFVYHYPAEQAVFAMLEPGDTRVARRFEAYGGGLELVNGFQELRGAAENRRRMLEENNKRRSTGKKELPLDKNFLAALEKGLPECSGAALGLDRLVMLALGTNSLEDVLPFTWEKS